MSHLPELRQHVEEEVYPPGSLIFRRGDPPGTIHILVSGAVELTRTEAGRRVSVQLMHPGEIFGDAALLADAVHPFDARALKTSRALSMSAGDAERMARERPEWAAWWLASIARRLLRLEERVVLGLAGGIAERVALFILRQAVEGEIVITQAALAEFFGAHRSSINRALKDLEAERLIEAGYSRIRILNPEGLARKVRPARKAPRRTARKRVPRRPDTIPPGAAGRGGNQARE